MILMIIIQLLQTFYKRADRKILQESEDAEEKEGLVRRYATQVKQAIQDFETKYEKE